ncbi:hypothetical protein ILYODFUR_028409 [Ilyodon furcidens]|uniref:Uncharacterized protein n=1 Tax=Ilyodon furcidens TaxID=33524 RepID=A0ABV0TYD6_9TELE
MLRRVLENTHCRSNHEPPFLSYLQSGSSEITSWKHRTIAHLPVQPPAPCTQLKHCRLRITKREHQHCEPPWYSCQTQPLWGRFTTSNKPSSATNIPIQIPPAAPVRILPCFVHIPNKLLNCC